MAKRRIRTGSTKKTVRVAKPRPKKKAGKPKRNFWKFLAQPITYSRG